jgi:hypothetical protein
MRLDRAKKAITVRRLVLVTMVYLVPLTATLGPVLDADIWWHLRTGHWIIEHGAVPRVDAFSTFGMGKPWVAYSWLFEVIVYGLYQTLGLVGIVLYTTAFSLLIAAALHRLVRRFALPFGAEILLTAGGLFAIVLLLSPRPWLFTMLFFIVELDLILMARQSGNHSGLWFLPPLFVVWANTHIQFCYGLLLLGLATVEPFLEKISPSGRVGDRPKSISSFRWLQVLVACFVATVATPYHLRLYSTVIGYMRETGVFEIILEFQPLPFREPWSWIVLFTALAAAFSLGRQRDLRPFPLLAFIAGAFLSFRTRRDLWFIVFTAVPIIAASVRSSVDPAQRLSMTKLRATLIAGAVIVAVIVIGWSREISEAHLEAAVAEKYPAAAAAVVEAQGYRGPLYNDFDWGGYLIWRLQSIPVVMDNRTNVHGDERIRRSVETWAGLNHWDSDPELLRARLVIASQRKALASLLRLDCRFELMYEDKTGAVFVARSQKTVQQVPTHVAKGSE